MDEIHKEENAEQKGQSTRSEPGEKPHLKGRSVGEDWEEGTGWDDLTCIKTLLPEL